MSTSHHHHHHRHNSQKSEPMVSRVATGSKARIHIIYYSMYGHVSTLAKSVLKGVEAAGAEGRLIQIPETLSKEVLEKMHAPEKDKNIPTISMIPGIENTVTLEDALVNCDGILMGIPTRFGGMPAQAKAIWDATGELWMKGGLVGKPIGVFFSTSTQGGGQETTTLTSFTNFAHHGMLFVPIGYTSPLLTNMNEIHGGSAYGAGTYAGIDGSRKPTELELKLAEHQGSHFSQVVIALKLGRAALASINANQIDSKQK
ncbi:unnamed protein product [Rotaria sp. Silwood2]|nr:unnamed protein product [Rotaria sp. Silwood2]CAF2938088.1 unnamed protein product [Rotaria sp. Silwood2]CAF3263126.1 unnamed protein product [Rotaria sp. Silwood2]CAF4257212.1 unnamed protein product [Rotaria sp. Silwood2]CAF4303374.1 unnamed protein product [Rotaria sp. Silwood2]